MLATVPPLTIGELCDEFGVTARALRFYEDEALIFPERRGTQRLRRRAACGAWPASIWACPRASHDGLRPSFQGEKS